jgi:predicted lipid-binding transport protein (Tim44 family)
MSHLGLGAEMGNLLTMALLGVVAFVAIRFVMRRFAPAAGTGVARGMQYAGAGAGGGNASPASAATFGSGTVATPAAIPTAPALPPGFDAAAFERVAKLIFIRLQAANDKADLEDLRQFATPEMFAVFKLDLQDRRDAPQQTDVVQLDAQLLDFAQEESRQVVSVRFHGLIREEKDGAATPFDEVWHLVKPTDGSREWAIAGIAQTA